MTQGKEESEWARQSVLMSWIRASSMGGKWINPVKLNPMANRDEGATPEQIQQTRKEKMSSYLDALKSQRKKGPSKNGTGIS
jgi:hypothetical protein